MIVDIHIIRWLTFILNSRFGYLFNLEQDIYSGFFRISIRLVTDVIDIGSFSCFYENEVKFCDLWNPGSEGFSAPLGVSLPLPGARDFAFPLVDKVFQGYRINYDILGLTYWMLSRQEEVGRTDLDEHGRFPATASHAFKNGYLERPVVDEWLDILGQVMLRVWPGIKLKQHHFNMKVSHDVDAPTRYGYKSLSGIVRSMGANLLKKGDVKQALLAPLIRLNSYKMLHPQDPFNTFDWIMDFSEQHAMQSAFYFICGRTHRQYDADYELEAPAIRNLLRRIHYRGHEIGLHPSYNTWQNPHSLAIEAERLKKVCGEEGIVQSEWGGRMHFLRWEHPTSMLGWEMAVMNYDSTLGYADRPGFRCGTCFEYSAFDPVNLKMLNLRIRPLIAMECTIMADRYMGLGAGLAAFEKFAALKNACKAVNGSFTLLWHNSQFTSAAERVLYQSVLTA
ncbi:MAG: polysaccharide deacetylase family protein [Chlorobium sp.]|nr:polysaccharide deacetylase family protein [Chlorobium sp.]